MNLEINIDELSIPADGNSMQLETQLAEVIQRELGHDASNLFHKANVFAAVSASIAKNAVSNNLGLSKASIK